MATTKYYTRSSEEKLATLYIDYVDGKVRLRTKTPIKIYPNWWDRKKQMVDQDELKKGKEALIRQYRAAGFTDELIEAELLQFNNIQGKKDALDNKILTKQVTNPTIEWLTDVIKQTFPEEKSGKAPENLNQYMRRFIEEAANGKRKTEARENGQKIKRKYRLNTVKCMLSFLAAFERWTGTKRNDQGIIINQGKQYSFESFNLSILELFIENLRKKGFGDNSIRRYVSILKTVIRAARNETPPLHNSAHVDRKDFKADGVDAKTIYLTNDEYYSIVNLDLSYDKKLEQARDLFIIGKESAQRYSDFIRITPAMIEKDDDGDVFLVMNQAKTGNEVVIPVSYLLMQTLQKYNFTPPAMCLSSLDRRIKVIARKAGITSTVLRDTNKRERAKGIVGPIPVPKYMMIASHTCRRTAATLMAQSKDWETSEIMDMTGHRTESELMKYIRTTKRQRAKDLSKKDYFKPRHLKIAK